MSLYHKFNCIAEGLSLRIGFRKKEVTRARILVPHSNKNQLKPIYFQCFGDFCLVECDPNVNLEGTTITRNK